MIRRAVTIAAYLLLAAGCVPLPALPQGTTHVSPLQPAALTTRLYLPLLLSAPAPIAKRGVCLLYGGPCADVAEVGASWYYTWGPTPPLCAGAEAVPMIWGADAKYWQVKPGPGWLMGWNEPDVVNQANIAPNEGAALWEQIEQRWPEKRLVAPAPAWSALRWLEQWFDAYMARFGRQPRMDALAVHCYRATAAECIAETQYTLDLAARWNVPEVWITEYGFLPCDGLGYAAGDLTAALREAERYTAWLDTQPQVTRYAWFGTRIKGGEWWAFPAGCSTALYDDLGLTAFGVWYATREDWGPY